MLHSCIKPGCGKQYHDEDPDDYYCPTCNEEKKKIAAELDKKFSTATRPQVVSNLQAFEATAKTFTDQNGRKIIFGRA